MLASKRLQRGFAALATVGIFMMTIPASRLFYGQAVQGAAKPLTPAGTTSRGSWPMFGGSPSRNMANIVDKRLPADWCIEKGKTKNIKWVADLGDKTFGSPVVAGGKVFVGTNNATPRDLNFRKRDMAVLMAFDEAGGRFLWQIVHGIPDEDIFDNWNCRLSAKNGLLSTPTVDGSRLYYVTPACEVIGADTDTGRIFWRYDMRRELGVVPLYCNICSPLVVDDLVYVVTANGAGEDGKVPAPQAPSFVALNKKTGKLVWQNNLPGDNILEGQWSNPTLATVAGKQQIIFPGGDAVLYALEPQSGKLIWKFRCNPEKKPNGQKVTRNYIIATPVVHDNKLYVGMGLQPEHPAPTRVSHFLCVDISKAGDVSPMSLDHQAAENKNSALIWAYGGMIQPKPKKGRAALFGPTMSTAAIHDGLVFISEEPGYLHCLDAKTGQRYWEHDLQSGVWGSPYYVDGKVYLGTDDGTVVILAASKKYRVIGRVDMDEWIQTTPVAANGVLYLTTKSKLYAIGSR